MSGLISIRTAIPADQPFLEALQGRASLANKRDRAALLANPDAIRLPLEQIASGRVIVAERDRAKVGFAVVLRRSDGDAELDGLFVDPTAWRGGIGRRLVEAAGRNAHADGASTLHVIGNPHAVGFYHACGFVAHERCKTRFGTAMIMRKRLEADAADSPPH